MLNIEIPTFNENIKSDSGYVEGTDLLKLFNGEHCKFAILKNPGINGYFSGTCSDEFDYNSYADKECYKYGLRFSIKLDELQEFIQESNSDIYYKNTMDCNHSYFYFGSHINNAVSLEKKNILDEMYNKGTLNKTNNKYHIVYSNSLFKEDEVDIEEYELDGEFFVRIVRENNPRSAVELSNGQYVYENGVYWLAVKPVKWILNKDKNVIVTEKLRVPFVLGDNKRNYFGDFKNTHIKKYIDTNFLNELLYHTSETFVRRQSEMSDEEERNQLRTLFWGFATSELLNSIPNLDTQSEVIKQSSKKGFLSRFFKNTNYKKYSDKDIYSVKQVNKK